MIMSPFILFNIFCFFITRAKNQSIAQIPHQYIQQEVIFLRDFIKGEGHLGRENKNNLFFQFLRSDVICDLFTIKLKNRMGECISILPLL